MDNDIQRKLAQFGAWALAEHRDNECCDLDGADLEKMAIKYGLAQWVKAEKPCGEDGVCWCLSYHGRDEFPVDCLRMCDSVRESINELLNKEGVCDR